MPSKVLCDTDSTQTLTNKTLTSPTITGGIVTLNAPPTVALGAATKGYVDGAVAATVSNGSLAASVASGVVTFSLRTAGGSVPSANDPVRITFRNSTAGDGSLVTRTVTSATTATISQFSTLGASSVWAGVRVWVGLIDNAGTVELCFWSPLSSDFAIKAFHPGFYVQVVAEGGAGGADSAHILYGPNARASVPFVLLGSAELGYSTPGNWNSVISVQSYYPGMYTPGMVVQVQRTDDGEVATGTTTMPLDDTIPQLSSEGTQFMEQAITPTNERNLLRIRVQAHLTSSNATTQILGALFKAAVGDAYCAGVGPRDGSAGAYARIMLEFKMQAGTAGVSTSYYFKAGTNAAATVTFNGTTGSREFGGAHNSFIEIEEVCA